MPLATAWVPLLPSRKLSVESNGFDFLGQLTMAGFLVFGACWSGLREACHLSRQVGEGWLLGLRCVVGQACERVRLPDLALSTSCNARD